MHRDHRTTVPLADAGFGKRPLVSGSACPPQNPLPPPPNLPPHDFFRPTLPGRALLL